MELSFGQRIDPENGLIQPWFTHGALDKLVQMDLSDKVILQYGSGRGDAWLAKRCKMLYSVERVHDWIVENTHTLAANQIDNVKYIYRPCNDCDGHQDYYCEIPEDVKPDIIIIDDAYRYECIVEALKHKPITIIIDNFMQDYVFICPAAVELLKDFEQEIYLQQDHTHHEGNPWKTAIFYLK